MVARECMPSTMQITASGPIPRWYTKRVYLRGCAEQA
jgi:hypothetical protein